MQYPPFPRRVPFRTPPGSGQRPPDPVVSLRRSPVVLRLEELELLLDAVQRLRDGEFERLARSLVRGLARRQPAREREARSDTARPPRGEGWGGWGEGIGLVAALPAAAGPEGWREAGRGKGKKGEPGPPRPRSAAHLLPTFPSLICRGGEADGARRAAPAPTHPLLAAAVYPKAGRAGSSPPTPAAGGTAGPGPGAALGGEGGSARPDGDPLPSFPRHRS